MIPSSPRLVAFAQSECDLTTPIVTRFVNVNTTDATAGATALLLPAQNTHTLHDPKRDT
jgi:hypothetical protein